MADADSSRAGAPKGSEAIASEPIANEPIASKLGPSAPPTQPDRAAQPAAPTGISLGDPQNLVHCLLFVVEYSASNDPRWQRHKQHLGLFFSRVGGVHLLLMLLNAYYNKPKAGRRPGWVFRGLKDRIQISERALRMLINDAMADGLIVQQPGEQDLRRHSYRLTPPVVEAWEALSQNLCGALSDVFAQFDPGARANVDYRDWDIALPASAQIETRPPSRRLGLGGPNAGRRPPAATRRPRSPARPRAPWPAGRGGRGAAG